MKIGKLEKSISAWRLNDGCREFTERKLLYRSRASRHRLEILLRNKVLCKVSEVCLGKDIKRVHLLTGGPFIDSLEKRDAEIITGN